MENPLERTQRDDVAVFVDFENVYVSVRENFDVTPNFELIMDRCADYGRIVIARAYADWYRYPRVTSALFANGVEPMYVPTYYYDRDMGRTGRPIKNSVDIHLCIDAMRTLYSQPHIAKYVLVTGDRDFIPLVNAIRQQGKEVIIIGIGGASSAHLAQSGDEFLFYEQIAELKGANMTQERPRMPADDYRPRSERIERNGGAERPERVEQPEAAEGTAPANTTERDRGSRLRDHKRRRRDRNDPVEAVPLAQAPLASVPQAEQIEAAPAPEIAAPTPEPVSPYDTLVEAVKLARQRGLVANLGSLKVMMRELDGDFHESKVKDNNGRGFVKFKDFVSEADRRGKVLIFVNGTVTEVFLAGEDPYRLSQFAQDLAVEQQVARDFEQEIVAEGIVAAPTQPAETTETAPADTAMPAVVVEAVAVAEAAAPAPTADADEAPSTGEPDRIFSDQEWTIFRTVMSQYNEPLRFNEIFNALRGLRNQEVMELTNNELKQLVKQALNRGMMQRTGRGAKGYYRLSSQYRITGNAPVTPVPPAPEVAPASTPASDGSAARDAATVAAKRRARTYLAQGLQAIAAQPEAVSSADERTTLGGEQEDAIVATTPDGELEQATLTDALTAPTLATDGDVLPTTDVDNAPTLDAEEIKAGAGQSVAPTLPPAAPAAEDAAAPKRRQQRRKADKPVVAVDAPVETTPEQSGGTRRRRKTETDEAAPANGNTGPRRATTPKATTPKATTPKAAAPKASAPKAEEAKPAGQQRRRRPQNTNEG